MDTKEFVDNNNKFYFEGTSWKKFTGIRYGIPNSSGHIKKFKDKNTIQHPGALVHEYKINFNEEGLRITPCNEIGREKHAIFFGDSQVIGEGVNDNETIPFYFAKRNSEYIPHNYGFFGYELKDTFNTIKTPEFQTKFRNKKGEIFYIYRDDYYTYSGDIDNIKRQTVLIKKINHLLRNISKQLNFTVVLLPLSFSSRALTKQLLENGINIINLFFLDTGFLTNDRCRYLDGGHTPVTNDIISKFLTRYYNSGYYPIDYFLTDNFKGYDELFDRISKQSFFMPCLQDVPEDDLLVIIKSITKRYTGIENKTQYLPTASKMHIQKMQLINSLREEKIIPEDISKKFLDGKLIIDKSKIVKNKFYNQLSDDYKNIFDYIYINLINNESN